MNANVKNVSAAQNDDMNLTCEIYVYKDGKLVKKLKKPFLELQELEDFIKIKYANRYISQGLMTISELPD